MSLSIQGLTKVYGEQKALDSISFEVKEGEIVGFLGPNGAGKSTTMKIATGFLPANEGKVLVNGLDVSANPEVKKVIGYLPEHNPLYQDMYVHEYLSFIGSLYGLKGKLLEQRAAEMILQCGLALEQNKKIEALSKGYRQRVGLAQALLHNPSVLILDEPTTGLDPNQILEIRNLIRTVSKDKTVIFSTHIMQEVQALCSRVVVINRGKIVADNSIDQLAGQQQSVIIIEFEGSVSEVDLEKVEGVEKVVKVESSKFKVFCRSGVDIRPSLFRFAAENKLSLVGLKQEESSLEEVFRQLTNQ
ncbi:MAG: gliding motility-associated ABC transporter ATP-binding subunit GldA [Flammeovirgaceae bacterium]|nr:gliding motility-associated ABC transporter ATP-binding subunit GldA [Flammeovirgaceae bacterium]